MKKIEIPEFFRESIPEIARAQRAKRAERRQRALARQARELARDEEREELRALAVTILEWAARLAESGLLDDLLDGLLLHHEILRSAGVVRPVRLVLQPDGSLESSMGPIGSAGDLLDALHGRRVRELAASIDSGRIWARLAQLNGASDATD